MTTKLNLDNLRHYRGYKLTRTAYGIEFVHSDYDGPPDRRCGIAVTVEVALQRIDELEDDFVNS